MATQRKNRRAKSERRGGLIAGTSRRPSRSERRRPPPEGLKRRMELEPPAIRSMRRLGLPDLAPWTGILPTGRWLLEDRAARLRLGVEQLGGETREAT